MIKLFLIFSFITNVHAYVPTVESIFRNGSNQDLTTNGVSVTFVVKRVIPGESNQPVENNVSLLKSDKTHDYYKIFFTKSGDNLKVAQSRYSNNSFSENSLEHKLYFPSFTAYTIKPTLEEMEKGLFFGLLQSLTLNEGTPIVSYLKALGVPVKLNQEIINREKVEFLAGYKQYLIVTNKDRSAKKTEVNPMRPEDPQAKARVDQIMGGSMYVDTKQVKLLRDEGSVAWVVGAGPFEAVAAYKNRQIQRIKYRTPAGDFEIICKDYFLANGTHSLPRFINIKGLTGQLYQIEILNLRHYSEREDDIIRRLKNWDLSLKGKVSTDPRPEFLL